MKEISRRTLTRTLAGALAVLMVGAGAGCSEKTQEDSSSSDSSNTVALQENDAKNADNAQADDSKAPAAQPGSSGEIDELNKKIEELSARIDELEESYDEFDFGEEIHEVYDDTAVVEAYKKKDPSGLTDSKDKYIYDRLVKAVDEIITDGMSDYEKEKAVYDYIFYGSQFDDESLSPVDFGEDEDMSHTPYGFFHDHNTICVGNATTFKLFMDVLGINCEIIHSTEEGEHAWNIVELDGDWYHVDVTFDGGSNVPLYSNFNVTDQVKEAVGYPWDIEDFHECTATKYNYVMMNAEELKDIYKLPGAIKEHLGQGTTAMYVTLPVPELADPENFGWQANAVIDSLQSDRYYFSSGEPVFSEDMDKVTLSVAIYDNEEEDGGWYEEDDPGYSGIDIDKLQKAFEDDLDGKVTLSGEYWW